jgi:hypothetical protein
MTTMSQQEETNMTIMSLDNTSLPGRPGPDESVPSRYALKVGEIDVLVISDGVLTLPTATLATNADPALLAAWLDDMFLPPVLRPRVRATFPRRRDLVGGPRRPAPRPAASRHTSRRSFDR